MRPAAICLATALLVGCGQKPSGAGAGGPPATPGGWVSDPALADELGPETWRFVGDAGFKYRPPAKYVRDDGDRGRSREALNWRSAPRLDKTAARFHVRVWVVTAEEENNPPDFPLQKEIRGMGLEPNAQVPIEEGTIRGQAFLRAAYNDDPPPEKGEPKHGVVYYARSRGMCVLIHFSDAAPHRTKTFPVMEAAARTFHFSDS